MSAGFMAQIRTLSGSTDGLGPIVFVFGGTDCVWFRDLVWFDSFYVRVSTITAI